MKSNEPTPGNPWPRDMAISVDCPHHLQVLLFVREAWGVGGETAVPDLDPVPDVGHSAMPDTTSRSEWERRWQHEWGRAWDWYDMHDPYAGYFADRITRRHLAVSPGTRADPARYSEALAMPYQP